MLGVCAVHTLPCEGQVSWQTILSTVGSRSGNQAPVLSGKMGLSRFH